MPEQASEPIMEEWLRSVGFKWHQLDRQTHKHWLLWIDRCMGADAESVGIEVTAGAWNQRRDDHEDWYFWLRSDLAGRYHRFIHFRHLRYQEELITMIEGLTGQTWDPANNWYGSMVTLERAERLRAEADRLDRRLRMSGYPWAEVEKDDSLGGALPEHLEFHEGEMKGMRNA